MIEAYLKYSNSGFACLPTNKDKMPAIAKGSTWKGGTKDLKEFEKSHGIALVCGKVSGNLECLDFDNHFGDIEKIFGDFGEISEVKEICQKYKFPIQKTVRGGYHMLYRCDLIEGNQKLASRQNEKSAETLIETRGEGGYFCVDPTPGYKILTETFDPPVITAEDRMILLSACRSFNEVVKPIKKPEEETDRPGDVYNRSFEAIDDMKSALTGAGWQELTEGIWKRPGKDKGISATLGKAAPGIFYNFSANGGVFEMNKGYTAFQVVALLKYNGNFKGFAKELHERQKPTKQETSGGHDFLIGKTANEWLKEASKRPIPKMLLSELWHETEFCIEFSTSGSGKSASAVMIGNSIASGVPIAGFKMEAKSQYVLYFDFELSDKQFEMRYSDNSTNHFIFDDKFIRFEIDPEGDKPEKMTIEEFLIASIEKRIKQYNAKILIIDNITYLSCDTEKAKEALPLMKKLKELKKKYDLSILALAHTPKRDESKPIGKNDLFGSSMIYNFCDSCFAIGKSTSDESLRYIKQIKERFTSKIYDSDNVIVCQIEKPCNCLQLTHIGYGKETDYLKNINENEKQVIKEMVQQRQREGKSYRDIAKEFNLSLNKVQRIIKSK